MSDFLAALKANTLPAPSEEQAQQLAAYAALLIKWNKAINLIGRSTTADIWQRHILDSYQLLPHIPEDTTSILDIGAGAGLPSVILAIMKPQIAVTACEINTKKSSFLTTAKRGLKLANFTVANADITKYQADPFSLITARAYATITEILLQSQHLSDAKTAYLLPKGAIWQQELDAAATNETTKNLILNMTTHTISSITTSKSKGLGQLVMLQPKASS